MIAHTYRIDIPGHNRPHYCRAPDDSTAIRYFVRARRAILANASRITLRVYKYQHTGWLWSGIDTSQPAEFWQIDTWAFKQ